MKITTWNIRHGGGSRIKEISQFCSENRDSDVLVITEFRNNKNKDLIINVLDNYGYSRVFTTDAESKINSVLVACKNENKVEVFDELKEHKQRVIKVKNSNFSIYACYFPQQKLKKIVFDFLLKEIKNNPNENIIIAGDFNTGKHYLDEKGASFYCAEYLNKLEAAGMLDAWRFINKDKREYSWYSNAGNGFRIDHFYVSNNLSNYIKDCYYNHQYRENKFSDHSSMTLDLELK